MAIQMKMILLSVVMLLIAYEPAFSGKIMNKLDKELKKMGLQKLKKSLAKIGTNAVDIGDVQKDMADVQNITVSLAKLGGYPDVTIESSYDYNVTGEVTYVSKFFCKPDKYSLPNEFYNKPFSHERGICLIKRITGTDTRGNVCDEYKSSVGTSYHKFAVINKVLSGCSITRIVN